MADLAIDRLIAALEKHGSTVRTRGNGQAQAQCPAHDDHDPSLSLRQVEGLVLLICRSGCDTRDVVAALGLTMADLYDAREQYYRYDDGRRVHRYYDQAGKKSFAQYGIKKGTTPQLYRRSEVAGAATVYLVEGEKDVHALESLGVVATTAPMGAANFQLVDVDPLNGKEVVAITDQDAAGQKWAQAVRSKLRGVAKSLEFRAPKVGKDAADHVGAAYGIDELLPYEPPEPPAESNSLAIAEHVGGLELDAFLGDGPPPYDWLVPGLLERGDRVILTGGEGMGKSTLLRQFGVQVASGIHPFGGDGFEPLRVLLLDLENSRRQVHRKLYPIRLAAGGRYAGMMVVKVRAEGMNLLDRDDGDWLLALCAEHQPDVLITGPAYKMAAGDPNEEGPARVVASYFDRLRKDHRCALLLEAHSPHASNGAKRPMRPYGASLWLRWPDFGLYLSETGQLLHWRGPRDDREWPSALQRGGAWPWTAVTRPRDVLWGRIVDLCTEAGDRLSIRDLAHLTGTSVGSVSRATVEHQAEWKTLGGQHG